MSTFRAQAKIGFISGIKKGWSSFVWVCQIVIPVSFLVAILQWTGWMAYLNFLLNPLMSLLNLPPEAAIPIISGMLINPYATIAIITVVPFTIGQKTLIAVFSLVCHNLILEGIVQHKSGINFIKTTLIRIVAAILTVLFISLFLGDTSQSIAIPAVVAAHASLLEALKDWGLNLLNLLLKVFGIIMFIMVVLELLKSLGWIKYLLNIFAPFMRVLGLSSKTTTMWVAATIFGLLYGGAVIVEESKNSALSKDELERIHIFVGISHAMVEDTALFAVLGINVLWLLLPRFVMAIIVVQAHRGLGYLKTKLAHGKAPGQN